MRETGGVNRSGKKIDSKWIDQELAGCQFKDERIGKRFRKLFEQLSEGTGESIPMACQDWANTKAAYRFFANERVNEKDILAGHFQATRERFLSDEGMALVLHDATEFSYRREDGRAIGKLSKKRPWFKAVRRLGWHYVGRIRGQAIIQFERRGKWHKLREFYAQASSQPRRFSAVRWGRWRQEELMCDLVLYRRASKGRVHLTHTGKRSQSIRSKRAERREGEPWLLVTSLPPQEFTPWEVVKIYRKRMQIEESFRDLKCVRYGCAFDLSLTRSCARLAILLLIHALASFVSWLTGQALDDRTAIATYGGVTTPRKRRHYSVFLLGWLALRHDDPLAQPRWILAALRCLKSNQTILGEIG